MLDYEAEAAVYDATRGGTPRAEAAAEAVLTLVPAGARTLLDIACGTGIVTERLVRPGLRTVGADAAHGMARKAVARMAGAIVLADVRRLPLPDASVDAVGAIWLLHMLPQPWTVVAEAARVLRPGGVFITTVDKDEGHDVGSDIDAVLAPHRSRNPSDRADLIERYAAGHGMRPVGEASFTGYGQGRTPSATAEDVLLGRYASRLAVRGAAAERLAGELVALPAPGIRRPDPVHRLIAFGAGRPGANSSGASGQRQPALR
ncbi:class I SAM-dependent methyltransferase [Streptomyces sp. NPDC051320]|uniref:class I SAM-dependent methyltransferase n=1 Tax=Streptomyces sp. NPDC051320 TaxID=3154644 RepID=UPI003417891D